MLTRMNNHANNTKHTTKDAHSYIHHTPYLQGYITMLTLQSILTRTPTSQSILTRMHNHTYTTHHTRIKIYAKTTTHVYKDT